MHYLIPIGTPIFPYASKSGQIGMQRLTSIELLLEASELTVCLELDPLGEGQTTSFYALSLDPNPSVFNSYVVRVDDLKPA